MDKWPYRDVDATAGRYLAASGVELRQFLTAQSGHLTATYYGRWLESLYEAGAAAVYVADVEECVPEFSMVHVVVVELPTGPVARERVIAAAAAIVRAIDPENMPNVGTQYIVLHTGE